MTAELRSKRLVAHESIYEHQRHLAMSSGKRVPMARGICLWCGEPIELIEGAHPGRRSRTRHRGDEWEVGDRKCLDAYLGSYAWNARELIELRGDPNCVDCGSDDLWDADHDIPLWAGGEHCPSNIVRRCDRCHAAKTAREAGERAERRRAKLGIPEPEPDHHPDQATLL